MEEYYNVLSERYGIELDDNEREKIEEYSGFCPTFLTGLGNRLASASINNMPQPKVEDVFTEKDFRTDYKRHYEEFLKRMQEDGLWNELVQVIMDISFIRNDLDSDDTFQEATIDKLYCRGYLREKENGEYVVISDDFSAWAKHKLYHNEISTIYIDIIKSEVAIRELLRRKMPKIWNNLHPGCNWNDDFLNNVNVPDCANFFTSSGERRTSKLESNLNTAKRYEPKAEVADALTLPLKIDLIKEYWESGIKDAFNSDSYSNWENCFDLIKNIRNPLFHAMIDPNNSSTNHFYLLKEVNEQANRIIQQLYSYMP